MALTFEQLQKLQAMCNTMPMAQLIRYAQDGIISSLDELPNLAPERRAELEPIINSRPNPRERQQWQQISALLNVANNETSMQEALDALNDYLREWSSARPAGNNVDDAQTAAENLRAKLKVIREQAEEYDWQYLWNNLGGTIDALMGHLYKYPNSVHANEIDDAVWRELCKNPNMNYVASEYRRMFPNGIHMQDVMQIENARAEWEGVKAYADPVEIKRYMNSHRQSPYMAEAANMLAGLKNDEIHRMREQGSAFDAKYMMELIDNGVFTEHELISAKVLQHGDLDMIRNAENTRNDLPDIDAEIKLCRKETAEGATDIFFFGIPGTGKSCILMGLINSTKIDFNAVKGGGNYAAAIQQYVDAGITIPGTPPDFIATIQANINTADATHPINLVEMSGEEFAFKLANNEKQQISFADMGAGAPELLRNSNRKVIFIIVDPTSTTIRFPHAIPMTDNYGNPVLNEEGKPIMEVRNFIINQRVMIDKMIDVIMDPSNADVVKNVDAIHFIVTKADVLDHNSLGNDRETEAYLRFKANFGNKLNSLIKFCQENDINATDNRATNGHPRLYSFSLGDFKIGGLFSYQPYDSDKLVDIIMENTGAVRDQSFLDRFLKIVNKPIF
ncbi:MAG: hypothetical protein NC097_04535 [Clostridium sp.]|nr:hypothetical protein [Prevotella sp.]MCM1429045.1 hypothetical protein [Clostridium sp.]MCM1475424.1 hypothetical protein [Muribaculaceae bacterium]